MIDSKDGPSGGIDVGEGSGDSGGRRSSGGRKSTGSASLAGGRPGESRNSPRIQAMKAAKKEEMLRKAQRSLADADVLRDPFQNAVDAKNIVRGETGVVFSADMLRHENPWDPGHIESPERLRRAHERCVELGLLERCRQIEPRRATDEEVLMVHSSELLRSLQEMVTKSTDEIKEVCMRKYHSVYANAFSLDCARLATGAAVDLTSAIVKGKIQNGLALVRPPGHHAMKSEFCGFCLFNSVAIAARNALANLSVKRVLIVDFDVHHGQATQQEFLSDPRVLYISIHRYEYGRFWPHLRESDYDVVGEKEGKGFNVNVPLNQVGMSDSDYLAIFHQLILPVAYEFSPELVLISAGFDAAIGCPEGEMRLSPMVYGHIISSLMALANGKVAVVLEGGYFIESLAEGVALSLKALLGVPSLPLGRLPRPCDSIADSILNCVSALRPFWQSLRVQDEYSISEYDAAVDKDCHEPTTLFEGLRMAEVRNLNLVAFEPGNFYFVHSEEKKLAFLEELRAMMRRCQHLANRRVNKNVAIAYDKSMTRHSNIGQPSHPEAPARIVSIMNKLVEFGLTERREVMLIDPRRATKEEICLCHDDTYFEEMAQTRETPQSELNNIADKLDSIFLNPDTFDCALLSCGTLLNAVDSVCNGDAQKAVAVIRPPGHHAESDEACGFCVFNNVAVAAKYALQTHDVKRVLILDWDVHHGNGIQNMFYDDPRVLYISVHRFDGGTFFPGRPEANFDYVGEGAGEGYNVNLPWNGSGMGDAEYACALFNVILPIAYQFDPELVLISAGFDAARGDPLGKCKVSPEMYGHIIQHIQNLANGRVIVALEGGYNINSISLAMTMCTKALLGDPLPPVESDWVPKLSAIASIRDVVRTHSKYWSSLRFGLKVPDSFQDLQEQLQKTDKTAQCNTSYTPKEYGGSYASVSMVNTVSRSAHGTESDLVSESGQGEHELAKTMSALQLGSVSTTPGYGGRVTAEKEYIPSQYGSSFGSPCVNTYSNASSASRYLMTDTDYSKRDHDTNSKEEKK